MKVKAEAEVVGGRLQVQIDLQVKGDLPGHPFRGNQWSGGQEWGERSEEEGERLTKELEDFVKPWADSLSDEGKETLKYYAGAKGGELEMNSVLRGQSEGMSRKWKDRVNENIERMDRLIDSAPRMPSETTVFRGVGTEAYVPDPTRPGISVRKKVINFEVGGIYEDPAYMSTSLRREVAEEFARDVGAKPAFLKITLPPGAKAVLATRDVLGKRFIGGEVVLPRSSKLRITKVDEVDGVLMVSAVVEG
jgi:hypothetical protein